MTRKLGLQGATAVVAAIREVVAEDLAYERSRDRDELVEGPLGGGARPCR